MCIESQGGWACQVSLETHLVQRPWSIRVTYSRLLGAISKQVFIVSKDGDTKPPGKPAAVFNHPLMKKIKSFSSCLNAISCVSVYAHCLWSCHWASWNMPDSIFFTPHCHQVFEHDVKVPLSLLFCRLNTLSSLNFSLCVSRSQSSFYCCTRFASVRNRITEFCALLNRRSCPALDTAVQMFLTADVSHQGWVKQRGRGSSSPSTCWQHSAWCRSGGCQPFLLQGHIAGSWSVCWQPWLPGPPLPSCFSADWPQPVLVFGIVLPLIHFPLLNLMRSLYNLWKFQWMSAYCSDRSDSPHASVTSTNMLRVQSAPSSRCSVKVLNTAGYSINPWNKALATGLQMDLVFDENP